MNFRWNTAKIRVPAEIFGSRPRFVVFARGGAPADLPWANRISRRAREESWMKCGVEAVLIWRGALARKSVSQNCKVRRKPCSSTAKCPCSLLVRAKVDLHQNQFTLYD